MECMSCDTSKEMKLEIVTHKYRECGLDNVTLVGIHKYRCEVCGNEHFNLGNIDELHQVIADYLIKKEGLLTGSEVRFLRTRLGYSGEMLANVLAKTKDHIYKIENGSVKMNESFDRLMRFAYMNKMPDRYYDLHDAILNGSGIIHIDSMRFRMHEGSWRPDNSAAS